MPIRSMEERLEWWDKQNNFVRKDEDVDEISYTVKNINSKEWNFIMRIVKLHKTEFDSKTGYRELLKKFEGVDQNWV
jgi:hypothetical protein